MIELFKVIHGIDKVKSKETVFIDEDRRRRKHSLLKN